MHSILPLLLSVGLSAAQESAFSPCPILGPRFPNPKSIATSTIVREALENLTKALDSYMDAGDGENGPVYPNTTSLSISLFSTEMSNSSDTFLYEYHHTATAEGNSTSEVIEAGPDTVYPIGDLTTLFTVYLFLKEAGEAYWNDPVTKFVPELQEYATKGGKGKIAWDEITLGDLAGNLGGIGGFTLHDDALNQDLASFLDEQSVPSSVKSSSCTSGNSTCGRQDFLEYFGSIARPVYSPANTPILSNSGFIILSFALETITGKPFNDLLQDSLLNELGLANTTLSPPSQSNTKIPSFKASGNVSHTSIDVEAPFNGLYSTLTDVSKLVQSIMRSDHLSKATTNRWLKPIAHTSNRANSIGRPWEIFSLPLTQQLISPMYQVRGNKGLASSHIGIATDYNLGFAIVGADTEANPDFNAWADILAREMVPALEENALKEAARKYAGTYRSVDAETDQEIQLTIARPTDSTPGLGVVAFNSSTTDLFGVYAKMASINRDALSMRLYPTDVDVGKGVDGLVMRAVLQDKSAFADAGTPTCDTWRSVDRLQVNGLGMDEFKFVVGEGGTMRLDIDALGVKLVKE
ncbi:unnamed protein product [Periconia digitata]|uniref:Beta-lactamase-related domain-containing protein n=1 Tax=Periconia digitata TaxID=1303443 RepID=A0A9W4UA18_9PLEO|nr:unnamed protein product [Periconia digitata]